MSWHGSNVAAMGVFDNVALLFSSIVAALTVVGELKDIKLCAIAVERAGDKLSPAWRFVLTLLGGMRRWCFLPTLTFGIPTLVINLGGDALSVCFNTVAVIAPIKKCSETSLRCCPGPWRTHH